MTTLLSSIKTRGAAAAITTTAACFGLTGVAAACCYGPQQNQNNGQGYQSSYSWRPNYNYNNGGSNGQSGYNRGDGIEYASASDNNGSNDWNNNQGNDHHGQSYGNNQQNQGNSGQGNNQDQNCDGQQGSNGGSQSGYGGQGQDDQDWGNGSNNGGYGNEGDYYRQNYDETNDTNIRTDNHVNVDNNTSQQAYSGNAYSVDNRDGGDVSTGNASNDSETETAVDVSAPSYANAGQNNGQSGQDWMNQGWDNGGNGSYTDISTRINNLFNQETNNTVNISNNTSQTAVSGNAYSVGNTWGGSVSTGNATNESHTVSYVVIH